MIYFHWFIRNRRTIIGILLDGNWRYVKELPNTDNLCEINCNVERAEKEILKDMISQ